MSKSKIKSVLTKVPKDALTLFLGSSTEEFNRGIENLHTSLEESKRINNIRCDGDKDEIISISLIITCHGKMNARFRDKRVDESHLDSLKEKKINLSGIERTEIIAEDIPLYSNKVEYVDDDETINLNFESIDTSNMNILFSNTTTCAMLPTMREKDYVYIKQNFVNEIMENPTIQHTCPTNRIIPTREKYGPVNILSETDYRGHTPDICLVHSTGIRPTSMIQKTYISKESDVYTDSERISPYDSGKIIMIVTKSLGRSRCEIKKYILLGPDVETEQDLLYTDFPEANVYEYISTIISGVTKTNERVWKTDLLRLLDFVNSITTAPIFIYDLSCNVFEESSYNIENSRKSSKREISVIRVIDNIMRKRSAYGSKKKNKKKRVKSYKKHIKNKY